MVERTDDHPGTGSETYCSAVSLRQASRTLVLAQRSYANNATTSSCMRISPGLGHGHCRYCRADNPGSLLDEFLQLLRGTGGAARQFRRPCNNTERVSKYPAGSRGDFGALRGEKSVCRLTGSVSKVMAMDEAILGFVS